MLASNKILISCFRCRKNRTWEKDRRDRLNNTFDKLARLLPEYQPKVTFSKIEILQKTIVYVEDLRLKIRELLAGEYTSILGKLINTSRFRLFNINSLLFLY